MNKLYSFHLVENSPWPILGSISTLVLTISGVLYMKGFKYGLIFLYIALILLLLTFFFWFRDVIREATYQGHHTIKVRKGLQLGMILFIVSEVFFFLAFFWAYFHSSLTPAVELGAIWPPLGINILNPWNVPLLNTILLLSSGVCQISSLFYFTLFSGFILLVHIILSLCMGSIERDPSRFAFYQEKYHGEYLLWLHLTIFNFGYCKKSNYFYYNFLSWAIPLYFVLLLIVFLIVFTIITKKSFYF